MELVSPAVIILKSQATWVPEFQPYYLGVCIRIPAKRQNKSTNQYKEKQEGDIDGEIREGVKKKINY